MRNGGITDKYMRGFSGIPFYMSFTHPKEGASKVDFDSNFNPHLKHDSEYFGKLNALTKCIETN